jgi:hypothetical protein
VSLFRQNATSLERLLALIRPVLDCKSTGLLRSVGETDSALAGLTFVELT